MLSKPFQRLFMSGAVLILTAGVAPAQVTPIRGVMTNRDVVTLAKAGFDEAFVMNIILSSHRHFDTSADALAQLANDGISQSVIEEMMTLSAEPVPAAVAAAPVAAAPVVAAPVVAAPVAAAPVLTAPVGMKVHIKMPLTSVPPATITVPVPAVSVAAPAISIPAVAAYPTSPMMYPSVPLMNYAWKSSVCGFFQDRLCLDLVAAPVETIVAAPPLIYQPQIAWPRYYVQPSYAAPTYYAAPRFYATAPYAQAMLWP